MDEMDILYKEENNGRNEPKTKDTIANYRAKIKLDMTKVDETGKIKISYSPEGLKQAELYLELLKHYQNTLANDRIVIFMQIGDFYEIYGVIYEDGTREGTLWDFARDTGLKESLKTTTKMFDDPTIKLYMMGFQKIYADKWFNIGIEEYGWVGVVINQHGEGQSIYRSVDNILSSGINTYSQKESNIILFIHLETRPSIVIKNGIATFAGVALLNCLTGECNIMQFPYNSETSNQEIIYDEIIKIITIYNPNEIIFYIEKIGPKTETDYAELINTFHISNYIVNINDITHGKSYYSINQQIREYNHDKNFKSAHYRNNMLNNIFNKNGEAGMASICEYLDINNSPNACLALFFLVQYVQKYNAIVLTKLTKPTLLHNTCNNLILANNTLEQLNIINNNPNKTQYRYQQSLFDILNKTHTHMGKRLLKNRLMNPITDTEILNARYDAVGEYLANWEKYRDISKYLCGIGDMEILMRRMVCKYMTVNDVYTLKNSIKKACVVCSIRGINTANYSVISEEIERVFVADFMCPQFVKLETSIFNEGVYESIDVLLRKIENEKNITLDLQDEIEKMMANYALNANKGAATKKKPRAKPYTIMDTNQITISNADFVILDKILRGMHDKTIKVGSHEFKYNDFAFKQISSSRKAIKSDTLDKATNKLLMNMSELRHETAIKFHEWCDSFLSKYKGVVLELAEIIANIDVVQSMATVAKYNAYVRPVLVSAKNSFIDATELRHPIIERVQKNIKYVANDVQLGHGFKNGLLVFGINASGKSSYMKAIGLSIIIAQAGGYVAADKFVLSPFRYLFTRILSGDNIYTGHSTFTNEMMEFKNIINYADANSIILGDELASGTETNDACSIVLAGIIKLATRKANFVFATHLHYLSNNERMRKLDNVVLKHMTVIYDTARKSLIYERKLKDGAGMNSYGIIVSRYLGLPTDFIELAEEIRDEITANNEKNGLRAKISAYNNTKIIDKCEICGGVAVDTHHIDFQCTANEDGIINNFHKDSKFNLVGLCKDCHVNVHLYKIKIHGYVETSSGIVLNYETVKPSSPVGKIETPKRKYVKKKTT